MVRAAPPAGNPANEENLAGAVSFAIRKALQDCDDMLPAKVLTYNRATNRAKIQIMVPFVTTGNEVQQRAIIASVPVLQLGAGGFVISFPVTANSLGWVKASDRDISIFKTTYSNSSGPPTQRLHSFSDAMFIPDTMMRGVTIAPEDADNLVIQNYSGSVKVAWWSTFLKIVAAGVGIGTNPADSAIFQVESTTKGAIPWPRMTTVQRDAISAPEDGMVVWLTDTHALSIYNSFTMAWS